MKIVDRAPFVVIVDSRESVPFRFQDTVSIALPDGSKMTRPVATRVEGLKTGDYSTPSLRHIGAVERKSASDFAGTITANRERFDREIVRLSLLRYRAIVCEGCAHEVLQAAPGLNRNALLGAAASFWARAQVPTFFCSCADDAARLTLGLLRRFEEEEKKRQSRFRFAQYRRAS